MSVSTYHKQCETPHKEAERLIIELETVFSRSPKYSYNLESAYFTNISFTKSYLRVMKRLCANISFVVEQKQIRAWENIIRSEIDNQFGAFYESAYADFHRKIEDCFGKYGFTSLDDVYDKNPG